MRIYSTCTRHIARTTSRERGGGGCDSLGIELYQISVGVHAAVALLAGGGGASGGRGAAGTAVLGAVCWLGVRQRERQLQRQVAADTSHRTHHVHAQCTHIQ